MYIDCQCIEIPTAETTGTTISYVVYCPFFSVLSLVMSLACRTADLLFSVHCCAPQSYWKCVRAKKKKKLAVHSELLCVIFFPPSSILLTHVLPYPTYLHGQPISFVSLTPLCTCMHAQCNRQYERFVSSNISDTQKTFLPMSRSEILCLAITQAKQKKKRVKMIFFLMLRCVRLYGTKGIVPDCIMWSVLVVWGISFRWK